MNGVVAQYWPIIPGGIHQVLHEPITGVDSFDVFGIEECSSADWNLKDTSPWVHLLITLTENHNIVLLWKHLIHNNSGLFLWGSLYPSEFSVLSY